MNAILVSFSIGFLGSLHCVGMCGGLIATFSSSRQKTWWLGLSVYQLGRISTYTIMGAMSGILGAVFSGIPGFHHAQVLLSILAGIMMITFGLHIAGWMPDPFAKSLRRIYRLTGLSRWVFIARTSTRPMSWFIVGLINGLLPCGLVYAGLSYSLTAGNVPQSILMMLSFGLGTIPAMMFAPYLTQKALNNTIFTNKIRNNIRAHGIKLVAMLVVCVGLITAFRGSTWMPHSHHIIPEKHSIALTG
jgi:sulfite exporter TauE/SafE